LTHRDGVDLNRWPLEILEDIDQIKVLEPELYPFQMSNFNFAKSDDHEGRIGEMDQTIGGGL
jgi:hypothetical protein